MANGKKSFILYCDLKHTVDLLDDALAGKLLKHLLRYVNDENPETDDILLKVAFEPIKRQLKRDLNDWETKRVKRVESGKLGGVKSGESRRKNKIEANEANASKTKQTKANEAVTVNVNDTVNVNVTDIDKKQNFKPESDYGLELGEMDVGRAIEYISFTKGISASHGLVMSLWGAFKTKNFTGEKTYKNDKDIIRHFFESLKYQQIDGKQFKKSNGSVGRTIEFDKP